MTPPTEDGDEREQGETGGPVALTRGLRSASEILCEDSRVSFPTRDVGPTTEIERLRIENQRLRDVADELRSWVRFYVERDNEKWWANR